MTPTSAEDALDDLRNYADGESVPADEARAVVAAELERLRQLERDIRQLCRDRYILGEGLSRWVSVADVEALLPAREG